MPNHGQSCDDSVWGCVAGVWVFQAGSSPAAELWALKAAKVTVSTCRFVGSSCHRSCFFRYAQLTCLLSAAEIAQGHLFHTYDIPNTLQHWGFLLSEAELSLGAVGVEGRRQVNQ